MPSVHDEYQLRLERIYCPPLDSSLVAAIVHEPGQTFEEAERTLKVLAGRSDDPVLLEPEQPGQVENSKSASTLSSLGVSEEISTSCDSRSKIRTAQGSVSSQCADEDSASVKSTVEQVLDEWEVAEQQRISVPAESPPLSRVSSEGSDIALLGDLLEATSLSKDLPVARRDASSQMTSTTNDDATIMFLQCAFPTRSNESLKSALVLCDYDVASAIEHIMTLTFVEEEEEREAVEAELRGESFAGSSAFDDRDLEYKGRGKGLDLEKLEWKEASSKAEKKRLKAERNEKEYTTHSSLSSGRNSPSGPRKVQPRLTSVHITDVRQGGKYAAHTTNTTRHASVDTSSMSTRHGKGALLRYGAADLSDDSTSCLQQHRKSLELGDAELAVYLDAEEKRHAATREAQIARDSDMDGGTTSARTAKDNEWLLTSSILEQLATLLNIESARVRATYNAVSFNLPITIARVVEQAAQDSGVADLDALDAAGDAPAGTALRIARTVAEVCGASLSDVETAMRATGGRQDAVIDLLNLEQTVKGTARDDQLPDMLDPYGTLRAHSTAAGAKSALHVHAGPATTTVIKAPISNRVIPARYEHPPNTPAEKVRSGTVDVVALSGSGAPIVSAPETVLGPSSAGVFGSRHRTVQDPLRRWRECREQSEQYLTRRNVALQKAASSWRAPTPRRGVPGAAMFYAEEARRLESKARAWDMRAAECLVEDRQHARVAATMMSNRAVASAMSSDAHSGTSGHSRFRNVIDLHGLTVHQSLSVVKSSLNEWYSRPESAHSSFRIITGAGNHSKGSVAILRPAVMGMLKREGWRADLDHNSVGSAGTGAGVIIVRGVA